MNLVRYTSFLLDRNSSDLRLNKIKVGIFLVKLIKERKRLRKISTQNEETLQTANSSSAD